MSELGSIAPLHYHLNKVWARGNPESENYINNWLGFLAQKPEQRQPVLVVKIQPEDPFPEFLAEKVFAKQRGKVVYDLEEILGEDNSFLAQTGFCVIKSLKRKGENLTQEERDRFGRVLTNEEIVIRGGNLNHRSSNRRKQKSRRIKNRVKFLIATDDLTGLPIEANPNWFALFEALPISEARAKFGPIP